MGPFVRTLFVVAMTWQVTVTATGQQGPQGGMGMGGGGLGGGQGGDVGARGDEDGRSLFLTPGDKTEWTFDAREHESIFVRITSSVFDPAVTVMSEDGVKIAENDDIEPGDQMAQLVVALPKPGKYKVVVTNYKGTAGGQFEFYSNRFLATELNMGVASKVTLGEQRAWARVKIDKPGDFAISIRSKRSPAMARILKPNGTRMESRAVDGESEYRRQRLFVQEPGMYFIDLVGALDPTVKVAPVTIRNARAGESLTIPLAEDELVDLRVETKARDLTTVQIEGDPEDVKVDAITTRHSDGKPLYELLETPAAKSRTTVATLNDVRIAFNFRRLGGKPGDVSVRVEPAGQPWPESPNASGKLSWFDRRFWKFEARPGDVVRLSGRAATYMVQMSVMDPDGNTSALAQHRTPEASTTLTIRRAGQYIVSVAGGGIGDYSITKEVFPPKALPTGIVRGSAQNGRPDVWRFTAKKGQDLVFRLTAAALDGSVQFIGPDGGGLGAVLPAAGQDLVRIKVPADGDYTVVVTSGAKSPEEYTLRWVDMDTGR